MKSQVTTKYGDGGDTRTLGGEKLPKSHPIIECAGCVDEARAYTALVRLRVLEAQPEGHEGCAEFLMWLIHTYFLIGAACSDPGNRYPEYRRGDIGPEHVHRLETEQSRIEERVKLPRQFIASAANTLAGEVDVLVTVVRRLERAIVCMKEAAPEFDASSILVFVNRLSDTLYMLARSFEQGKHVSVDYTLLDAKPNTP
jgi:cob(I)alamin adenosyltransferase